MYILIAGYENQTKNYQRALQSLGAEAACLPLKSPDVSAWNLPLLPEKPSHFDGLLLPGGGDIHPDLFGQSNQGSGPSDLLLDLLQLHCFHTFYRIKKPILGICKGMQLINIALGGTLLQDLPDEKRKYHAYNGQDQLHPTTILPDTFLCRLYGPRLVTNSAHHQSIHRLGEDLMPAQYGPGQVLEAFYHNRMSVLGVQWHPERMPPFTPSTQANFSSEASRQRENQKTGDGSLVLQYFLSLCRAAASPMPPLAPPLP